MSILTILGSLVKGKALATTAVSIALLGGTGTALAATPAGRDLVQNLPGIHTTASPTHTPEKKDSNHGNATTDANKQRQQGIADACAGLTAAQQLATKFSLSTKDDSDAIKVICALHDGNFQSTVDGKKITLDHPLGYGEIEQLLTYAKVLAAKEGKKLPESDIQEAVATLLKTCGSTPIVPCINGKTGGNGQDNDGKPISIPTPHFDGKPPVIPTPHGDWKQTITPQTNNH